MLLILLVPGRLGSCHLNDKTANTPDVSTSTILSSANDLRCHPVRRALHRLRHLPFCLSINDLSISKISDLALSILTEEYICSFYISVNNTKCMKIFKTRQDIPCVLLNQFLVKLSILFEQAGDRPA